jgi:hypothetical protein
MDYIIIKLEFLNKKSIRIKLNILLFQKINFKIYQIYLMENKIKILNQ